MLTLGLVVQEDPLELAAALEDLEVDREGQEVLAGDRERRQRHPHHQAHLQHWKPRFRCSWVELTVHLRSYWKMSNRYYQEFSNWSQTCESPIVSHSKEVLNLRVQIGNSRRSAAKSRVYFVASGSRVVGR